MGLKNLIIDDTKANEDLIESIISGYVNFNKSGSIFLTPKAGKLSNKDKVIVYLVARKSFPFLNIKRNEPATPAEITSETQVPRNTVGVILLRLFKEKLVIKSKDGYLIPNYLLNQIKFLKIKGKE